MDLSFLGKAQQEAAREVIGLCVVSRVFFIKEILGVDHIEPWQMEVLEALDAGETKISIRSGHGVGKTCLCSWLAVHFLTFRDDVKVIVTSPSSKQLQDGLIPEINKWIARMPEWMSASIDATSERVVRKPNTSNNFISFRTARKENPEALAGVHAEHVMIIVDEASGVEEVIYETGQGALSTEGAIALLIGNPTRPTGFFYKTQTSLSDLWWTRKVSCMDSSRVDEQYISSQARTYGVDSREYRVRVLGEFPESGADAVIPRAFVERAYKREVSEVRGDILWGVDVGRGGDPSGFCERTSNAILELRELRYVDVMNVVGWVHERYRKVPEKLRPAGIYVDSIGLGAGVADRLLELDLPVIHVNVAEAAAMSDRYRNLRAEMWFLFREWLESAEVRIECLDHLREKFAEECASTQYKFQSDGRVILESKEDMKRRGVSSPNMAEAACMTFTGGGGVRMGSFEDGVWGGKKIDTLSYRVPGLV